MKPFFRALLMSFRYKWSILGAVLCAVMISVLWSFSISAILPVVQVVLKGETFHEWVDEEIKNSTTAISKLETEIEAANKTIAKNALPKATHTTTYEYSIARANQDSDLRRACEHNPTIVDDAKPFPIDLDESSSPFCSSAYEQLGSGCVLSGLQFARQETQNHRLFAGILLLDLLFFLL